MNINRKKLIFIGIYLLILLIIWYFINGKKGSSEGYETSTGGIIKTFATILKDQSPEVAQKSLLFMAVTPTKRRNLPSSFPGNDLNSGSWPKYKSLISSIANQGSCGSCWAFATSLSLGDRFSLLSNGKIKVQLSPGKLAMCTMKFSHFTEQDQKDWANPETRTKLVESLPVAGCSGNDLYSACEELYSFGTMSERCVPYDTENTDDPVKYDIGKSSESTDMPKCWKVVGIDFDTCADGKTAARIYRAADIYSLRANENDIMQEIFRWGSVAAGFRVYSGFVGSYDGKSIYTGPKQDESVVGGHAVRIVGWGEENGVGFWWIANSWSTKWGLDGYFRMKRMIPECALEQNVVGMKPEFPGKAVWSASLDLVQPIDKTLRDFDGHTLNDEILYWNTAVSKIREGKLTGDLTPLVEANQLPNNGNYKDFWMADMLGGNTEQEKKQTNTTIILATLAILGTGCILVSNIN